MKSMSKKKTFIIVSALLILAFGAWRFLPHTLSEIAPSDTASQLACSAMISGVDNGKPFIDGYTLQPLSQSDEDFEQIIGILSASQYRPDFRNLLPWETTAVDGGKLHNRTATILFWGTGDDKITTLGLIGSNVTLTDGSGRMRIYHPTNPDTVMQLTDYLQAHGVKS